MWPAESLDEGTLCRALAGQTIGNRIIVLEETTSTNDVVAQLEPKSAEGLVVIAEKQTAGRGQYGRRWDSAARKGLWLSVLLRPQIGVAVSGMLTELIAQAIAGTIEQLGCTTPLIKPPNDVYVGRRKIAGVLVEMRVAQAGDYYAIAGLGVNVNHAIEDFPEELRDSAGSIASCIGGEIDRQEFAVSLLREFESRYRSFSNSSAARAVS